MKPIVSDSDIVRAEIFLQDRRLVMMTRNLEFFVFAWTGCRWVQVGEVAKWIRWGERETTNGILSG